MERHWNTLMLRKATDGPGVEVSYLKVGGHYSDPVCFPDHGAVEDILRQRGRLLLAFRENEMFLSATVGQLTALGFPEA